MGASASAAMINQPSDSKKKSEVIDRFLETEKAKANKRIKLLLLGRPESGKSTLARHIRILHDHGFTESEKMAFGKVIRQNVFTILKTLLRAIDDLGIEPDEEYENLKDQLSKVTWFDTDHLAARRGTIKKFLSSASFHQCIDRRWEINLQSSAFYLLEAVERILNQAYVPSNNDILKCRVSTSGLQETSFKFKGFDFRMVDVGCQKSDSRKWIPYFDNVSALIYTIDVSCYDKMEEGEEGKEQNSLLKALNLCEKIINYQIFKETTCIIFLNKCDLLQEKIRDVSIRKCFPEYKGEETYEEVSKFLLWRFKNITSKDHDIYTHMTNATDTDSTRTVLDMVIETILQHGSENTNLY